MLLQSFPGSFSPVWVKPTWAAEPLIQGIDNETAQRSNAFEITHSVNIQEGTMPLCSKTGCVDDP